MISSPSSKNQKWIRSWLPGLLIVLACSAAVLGVLKRATPDLTCPDGYFHIRYAEVLRTEGLSRTFPWWQETFLRDHWADKDFMLHVLLIPFTFGDLLLGAKIASVVFATIAMGVFYLAARALRVPWPSAWALGLLISSAPFLFRLGFTRSWVFALMLAVAGTCAIFRGSPFWAFVFAALYPSAHISFHLLPCIALFHAFQRPADDGGSRSFRIFGWTLAGALTGVVLNPFFPNDLYLWWVQNIRVLGLAWGGPPDLRPGMELLPRRSDILLRDNLGVFIAMAGGIWLCARGRRVSSEARTLLAVSCGFLALSMRSVALIEFWSPFALLFAAVSVRDQLASDAAAPEGNGSWGVSLRARRRALVAVIIVCGAAVGARNLVRAWRMDSVGWGGNFVGASAWMKENVPAGQTIFHLDWDDFPELFFFNPQYRYLVGLDPTFMYVTDPGRWRLYTDLGNGEVDDLYTPIRDTFRCRWVCATSEDDGFLHAARRDPRFEIRYEDQSSSVFFLKDDPSLVSHWRVTGWYADPARRLLDVPLGPEPGARADTVGDQPEVSGPAARGTKRKAFAGFVDLTAALAVPPIVTDVCGFAEAELLATADENVTIGVTTDDEVRVYVEGEKVLEDSPFRHPLPGHPGGPPVSLDDVSSKDTHIPERTARATLHAGNNRILVKCCRSGEDFGFFLRAWHSDGSPVPSEH